MRDEVAIITGAASGIGRHFAGVMKRRGHPLVLTDIDRAGLERVFEPGDRLLLRRNDIRDRDRWREILAPGLAVGLTRMLTAEGLRTMERLRRERSDAG